MQAAGSDDSDGGRGSRADDGEVAAGTAPEQIRLMAGSGQSKASRQDLRRRQRELAGVISDLPDDAVGKCRWKNNMLWSEVRYPQEARLDANNLGVIAEKAAAQADRLVTAHRYDAARLAAALAKKGSVAVGPSGKKKFNWHALGVQVGVCFNAVPSNVSFLHGPLEMGHMPKERKVRAKKEWRDFEEGEEETPIDVEHKRSAVQDHELSAVGRNIRKVREALHQKSKEQRDRILEGQDEYIANIAGEGDCDETVLLKKKRQLAQEAARVDVTDVLFDQGSFTRTVENVYNFSFDIFHGLAGIKRRKLAASEGYREAGIEGLGPGPVVYPAAGQPRGNRQAILSLNMEQWRRMCRVFHEEIIDEPPVSGERRGKRSADSFLELKSPPEMMNAYASAKRSVHPVVSQTDSETFSAVATPSSPGRIDAAASATVTPEKEPASRSLIRTEGDTSQHEEQRQFLSAFSQATTEEKKSQAKKRKTSLPDNQRTLDAWAKVKAEEDASGKNTGNVTQEDRQPICIDLCDDEPPQKECIDLCDEE
ncbi:hypothetical protein ACHAXT_005744 [Thalassiosira profunda]